MAQPELSREDVERLLSDPSPDVRRRTAEKLASEFREGGLSSKERELAEDILRLMVRDAELMVRKALAVSLQESAFLPHDVALSLARDVDEVALPFLQFSTALSDSDLIEIVNSQDVSRQVAIARRPHLSPQVSDCLVDTKNQEVVSNLVANEGAELSEISLQKIVDEFGDMPAIQGSLVNRTGLPVTVVERLVVMVSDQLRDRLAERQRLPPSLVSTLVRQSRERATVTLAANLGRDDVEELVRHLKANARLTPSIILRGVCMGDMPFFEAALAELGDVPLLNAQKLIHDPGRRGFEALYEKARLPKSMYPAFAIAVEVARETTFDGGDLDRERYCRRMIERILTQYEDMGVSFNFDDLEYLLAKIDHLPPNLYPNEDLGQTG